MEKFATQVSEWRAQHPLRLYMDERGITQIDLAALMNVTKTSINSWVAGARIRDQHLRRLREMIPGFDDKVEAWRQASPLMHK